MTGLPDDRAAREAMKTYLRMNAEGLSKEVIGKRDFAKETLPFLTDIAAFEAPDYVYPPEGYSRGQPTR